jgi:hypothetical protein
MPYYVVEYYIIYANISSCTGVIHSIHARSQYPVIIVLSWEESKPETNQDVYLVQLRYFAFLLIT